MALTPRGDASCESTFISAICCAKNETWWRMKACSRSCGSVADAVVHPGQGHAARGGQVPHGGGVVALVRKDPGGAGEQVVETLVVWSHVFERLFEFEAMR